MRPENEVFLDVENVETKWLVERPFYDRLSLFVRGQDFQMSALTEYDWAENAFTPEKSPKTWSGVEKIETKMQRTSRSTKGVVQRHLSDQLLPLWERSRFLFEHEV